MKKVFLSVAILFALAGGFFFRDSFRVKISLSPASAQSGTIFHDQLRATAGYHIVDHFTYVNQCSFAENPEWQDLTLPGSLCAFLESGSYIGYSHGELAFWNPNGLLGWKKKIHAHHDISVDEKNGTIFVVSGNLVKKRGDKFPNRLDALTGYDLEGKEIFHWEARDHWADLEAALHRKLPLRFNGTYLQYTHLNSVQEIPETPIAAKLPAFKAGNILVNDFYGATFVIDRNTKKIVWHYVVKGGAHSTRLNEEGQIVFLANNKSEKGNQQPSYSTIDFLDPLTKKIVHSIAMNPKERFFTSYLGSLQLLPGNRLLVTSSLAESAFEIDRNGRIFWEWVSPKGKWPPGSEPIYRVQLVPKARIEKMISAWRPF